MPSPNRIETQPNRKIRMSSLGIAWTDFRTGVQEELLIIFYWMFRFITQLPTSSLRLPHPLLSLILVRLPSLFALDLRDQPLELALVLGVLLSLLLQPLSRHEACVLSQFPQRTLSFFLVRCFELAGCCSLAVGVVVSLWVVGFFEFGN